jgi:hypothetical protein
MIRFILLYFLLTSANSGTPQTIGDYFKIFPHRPEYVSPDSVSDHQHFTIDDKNAYLYVSYDDPDYGYEYGGELQFTYFLTQGKQKIFGYSSFFDGPSSVSAHADFYTFNGKEWKSVTTSVLPAIELNNFTSDKALLDRIGSNYRVRFSLPQQGTDVHLKAYPVGENDALYAYDQYTADIAALHEVVLQWNKPEGVFKIKLH